MARRNRYFLIALALSGAALVAPGNRAFGEEPTLTIAALESVGDDVPGIRLPRDPDARREALEKMDPEMREKLRKNFEKWQKLSPDEKKKMRNHFKDRGERMRKEIVEAMEASGLELGDEEKRVFAEKYLAGRREIEKDLREERKRRIEKLVENLKAEFEKEESGEVVE